MIGAEKISVAALNLVIKIAAFFLSVTSLSQLLCKVCPVSPSTYSLGPPAHRLYGYVTLVP